MKANELRIGNWIERLFEGESTGIEECSIRTIWDAFKFETEAGIHKFQFQPIPLTEEWLLKFGFEKWGRDDLPRTLSYSIGWIKIFPSNSFCDFMGYGFIYYKPDHEKSTESARVNIQNLHQLQNLYFALTGEELKLV